MKRLLAFVFLLICALNLAGCSQKKQTSGNGPGDTIVDISDWAVKEGLECVREEELFYEDENTQYYFSEVRSPHTLVTYNNGYIESVVTALEEGRITIADLNQFGNDYFTKPKSD